MAGKEVKAGKAFVEIMLRDDLQAGLNRASKRLKSFGTTVAVMGAALGGVSAGILAPLAAAVTQFSSTGDEVQKMAARTGLSAEAVSELSHAANLSGTDLGAFEKGVRRMQRTIVDAAGGLSTSEDALASVGLAAKDLDGLMPDDQFALIADRISGISDPAHRAAAAMEIFGRSGTDLIPMMAGGAAGIEEMRQQARDLGLTISGETADSAAQLNDALGTMWSTVKGLTLNIGAALAPAVTDLVNRITPLIGWIVKFVQNNQRLVTIVAAVGVGLGIAAGVLLAVGAAAGIAGFALSGLATIAGFVASGVGLIGTVIAAIFSPIGLIVAAVTAAVGAFLYFSGAGSDALEWLQDRFGRMVDFVRGVAGEISEALAAGDIAGAARILWSALQTAFAAGIGELVALWGYVSAASQSAWNKVLSYAASAWGRIVSIAGTAANWLAGVWANVSMAASSVWEWIVTAARDAMGRVAETFRGAVSALSGILGPIATTVGNTFSNIAGLISSAFSSVWQLLANGASQVGSFFMAIFGTIGTSLGSLVSGVSQTFSDVASSAMESFGAIGQALAGGDFGLAAEIAWTSIQLAFATGIAWVTNAWTEFATGLTSIFDGAIVAIRQIWNNISTWIARQMFNIVGLIQKAVAKLASIDPTGLSDRLSAAIEFDVEGAIKILEEDKARFNTGLDTAKSARDDTRVNEMQDRIAKTESDLAALRERRQKSIDEAQTLADSGGPSLLDKILSGLNLPELPKLFATPQLDPPPELNTNMQAVGSTGPALGTFSAAVAGMLGRSGESDAADRTADAAEKTAEETAAIRKELEDRPVLAFE